MVQKFNFLSFQAVPVVCEAALNPLTRLDGRPPSSLHVNPTLTKPEALAVGTQHYRYHKSVKAGVQMFAQVLGSVKLFHSMLWIPMHFLYSLNAILALSCPLSSRNSVL